MRKSFLICFGIFINLIIGFHSIYANDWEPALKKNGIETYSRRVKGSNFLEIRAITVVDARLEEIAELLRDIPAYPKWRPSCKYSKLIESKDSWDMVVYSVANMPWPVYDRDIIVRAKTIIDLKKARAITNIKAIEHPTIPVKKGIVRINELNSQYIFEYIDRDTTGVVFTTKVNPAGSIPSFLVNLISKYFAYEEMLALTRMVKLEKYIRLGKNSIDKTVIESSLKKPGIKKQVFKARIKEFIKDKEFVNIISNNEELVNRFSLGTGELERLLLFGMGLRKTQKMAVKKLLEEHLKYISDDNAKISEIIKDENIIDMILNNTFPKNKSFKQLLASNPIL